MDIFAEQPVAPEPDDPLKSLELRSGRLILSLAVFIAYTTTMVYILYKVRFRLDCQAYFTMISFFLSIFINLVVAIVNCFDWESYLSLMEVPKAISDFVIISVFYKFAYEIRHVRLKLESSTYEGYRRSLSWQRCVFVSIFLLISVNLFLTVGELLRKNSDKNLAHYLQLTAKCITFVTDQVLLVMLYVYFCYFFQRKKQALTRQYGVFTLKQKALVIWCLVLLLLNIVLVFLANILDIATVFEKDLEGEFIIGRVIMYFWYELLVANNGILFLFLFKYLASYKRKTLGKRVRARKRKEKKANAPNPGGEVQATTNELMTDS